MKSLEDICLKFEMLHSRPFTLEKHDPYYFYHVSYTPIGDSKGIPQETVYMRPRYIHSGESELHEKRRICVAPTVEQAINACAQPINATNKLFIYRTKRKLSNTYVPFGVFDAPLTGERWLTRKTSFKLIGTINTASNKSGTRYGMSHNNKFTTLDFNNRGGWSSLYSQRKELPRVRKFVKDHSSSIFFSEEDWIHNMQQSSIKLNRKVS